MQFLSIMINPLIHNTKSHFFVQHIYVQLLHRSPQNLPITVPPMLKPAHNLFDHFSLKLLRKSFKVSSFNHLIANFFAALFQSSVLILVVRGNAFLILSNMEEKKLRNKEKGFPNQNNNKFQGEPRAKPIFFQTCRWFH